MINFKNNQSQNFFKNKDWGDDRNKQSSPKETYVEKLWRSKEKTESKKIHTEDLEKIKEEVAKKVHSDDADGQEDGMPDVKAKHEKKEKIKPKKISIKHYKDPEGMTIKKMEIGLWLVKHRPHMKAAVCVILILVSAVTWFTSFYSFGYYIIYGMKNDEIMINQMLATNTVGHDYFVARQANDLQYQRAQILSLDDNKYDMVARLRNPNPNHAARFTYSFSVQGREIERTIGFILPGETKYIIALNKKLTHPPTAVNFTTDNLRWTRLNRHEIPDWEEYRHNHLNIIFSDVKFIPAQSTILTEKVNLNDLHFMAINNTAYNYREAALNIFLFRQNEIIGVNQFVLSDFMSGQIREADMTWLGKFSRVDNVVISPDIDILRDDIYLKFEGGVGEEK